MSLLRLVALALVATAAGAGSATAQAAAPYLTLTRAKQAIRSHEGDGTTVSECKRLRRSQLLCHFVTPASDHVLGIEPAAIFVGEDFATLKRRHVAVRHLGRPELKLPAEGDAGPGFHVEGFREGSARSQAEAQEHYSHEPSPPKEAPEQFPRLSPQEEAELLAYYTKIQEETEALERETTTTAAAASVPCAVTPAFEKDEVNALAAPALADIAQRLAAKLAVPEAELAAVRKGEGDRVALLIKQNHLEPKPGETEAERTSRERRIAALERQVAEELPPGGVDELVEEVNGELVTRIEGDGFKKARVALEALIAEARATAAQEGALAHADAEAQEAQRIANGTNGCELRFPTVTVKTGLGRVLQQPLVSWELEGYPITVARVRAHAVTAHAVFFPPNPYVEHSSQTVSLPVELA